MLTENHSPPSPDLWDVRGARSRTSSCRSDPTSKVIIHPDKWRLQQTPSDDNNYDFPLFLRAQNPQRGLFLYSYSLSSNWWQRSTQNRSEAAGNVWNGVCRLRLRRIPLVKLQILFFSSCMPVHGIDSDLALFHLSVCVFTLGAAERRNSACVFASICALLYL